MLIHHEFAFAIPFISHNECRVLLQSELEEARALLNDVIEQGQEYPQRNTLDPAGVCTLAPIHDARVSSILCFVQFRAYFLSHGAFAVSVKTTGEASTF